MALNPINMQVSIPRTSEASHIQQQALHKPIVDQTELGQQALKKTELSRTKTEKTSEAEKVVIREENSSSQQHQHHKNNDKNKKQPQNVEHDKSIHPYKGHSIDIKL